MSKLANPWKCDASGCGMLRANDTNHWMVIYVTWKLLSPRNSRPTILIEPWNDERAECEETKHACGVDCGLKIAAQLIDENFFGNANPSTRSEVRDGES